MRKILEILTTIFLCFLVLFNIATSAIATPTNIENLPIADLTRFQTSLSDSYPPTVCALRKLAADAYYKMLKRADEGGISGATADWERDTTEAGSVFFVNRHWQNPGGYILWVHISGAIVLGIRIDNLLEIFTNAKQLSKDVPSPIRFWIEEGQKDKLPVRWITPDQTGIQFPEECKLSKLVKEVDLYRSAHDGTSCELNNLSNLSFTQIPAVVKPKNLNAKVFLLNSTKDVKSDRYLIAGDMVQLLTTDFKVKPIDGKICVFYRSAKGKASLGWVIQNELLSLPEDDQEPSYQDLTAWMKTLSGSHWFAKSFYRVNFPGKYKSDYAKIADTLEIVSSSKVLKVKLKGDSNVFDTESFESELLSRRFSRYEEVLDKKVSLSANIWGFNNAIFVHLKNHTMQTHYWGIYYP